MTKREMSKFKKLLEAEYQHLSQGIRKIEQNTMEGAIAGAGADLTSFAEAGTDSNERDTALRVASGESNWLRDVSEALARIENAAYGMCEGCGKEIPIKRLEVFPSARNCVTCQAKLEKHGAY
jgi:DnaK suppressor protein